MRGANESMSRGWFARRTVVLGAILLALLGALAVLPLQAGDSSTLPSLQAGGGTPTRGESGWINLPHLRGLARIERSLGVSLFNEIESLHANLGLRPTDPTAGAAFVVEGLDADLTPCMVRSGIPEISVASLGDLGWQAVLVRAFQARFEPELIRPADNLIGVVFPSRFVGAILRISGVGLTEEDQLYFLVESEQVLLSWQAIVNLAGTGVSPVLFEGICLDGDRFKMSLGCLPGDTCLDISFGSFGF